MPLSLQNDPKLELGPHVKQRSLSEAKVGTWTNIFTVSTVHYGCEHD